MSRLFHILDKESWLEAQKTGLVPRNVAEEQENHVHLNTLESVEKATDRFFAPNEEPVALEIDTSEFNYKIVWYQPSKAKPWLQPCAKIQNIPISAVVKVHDFELADHNGQHHFKMN